MDRAEEEKKMDEALLRGAIGVDEYATTLLRELEHRQQPLTHAQWVREKEALTQKTLKTLQAVREAHLMREWFTRWKLAVAIKREARVRVDLQQLESDLEASKHQNATLARQKKELQARVTELNDRRTHTLDVSDLSEQLGELVQELEKVKAEKAALVAKSEHSMLLRSSRRMLSVSTAEENIPQPKQNEAVGKMVREYQSRVQRLEEELSNEKLKRANESAKRLEKESECMKYKREVEDAKAEVVSLQLRLARLEANGGETVPGIPSTKPRVSFMLPQVDSKSGSTKLEDETFTSRIADYHEVTASNTLTSNAPRKSFFKPAGAQGMKKEKAIPAISEEDTANGPGENCAQQ